MKTFRKIMQQIVSDDPFGPVFSGDPFNEKYIKALNAYSLLSESKRIGINERITNKLRKKISFDEALGTMLFSDYIITAGHKFYLVNQNPENSTISHKDQKHAVAQKKFVCFYYEYLRTLCFRNSSINWKKCDVETAVRQARLQIEGIIELLRVDFVITYCLQSGKSGQLLKMIVRRILQRTCDDLGHLNRFVQRWSYLILDKTPIALDVNQVYQKLIFINKEFNKLDKFKNVMKLTIFFPRYRVNKELNMTIEKELLARDPPKARTESLKKIVHTQNDHQFVIEEEPPSVNMTGNQEAQLIVNSDQFI